MRKEQGELRQIFEGKKAAETERGSIGGQMMGTLNGAKLEL